MYNHNFYDVKESNGLTTISTGIDGRGGPVNLSISYSEFCNIIFKQYNLTIDDFIYKSRSEGSFEIDYSKEKGYTIYSSYGNICIGK